MATKIKQAHGGALWKPEKGETMNPNGRPRKYVSQLKEQGYKLSEINDTIQSMMAMSMDELKAVWDNQNATILERTIANAMKKSLEKGSLYSLETLLSRVYGKPKESSDVNQSGEMTIKIVYGNRNNTVSPASGTAEGTE